MDINTKIRMAAGTFGPGVHLDSIEAAKIATALCVLQRVADNECTNPQREAKDAMRHVTE